MEHTPASKNEPGRKPTGNKADDSHVIRLDDETFKAMEKIGKPVGFSVQRVFDMCMSHHIGTEPGTRDGNIRVAIKHSLSKLTG